VLAEALGWMAEAIPEFGLACMDVKAIIEWMKADLGSANAPGQSLPLHSSLTITC
jgi:cytoskeleton-associated protein 5